MKLKIKKLYPDAVLPSYAKQGDAGMDIFAYESLTLAPGERGIVKTGIAMEFPEGYVFLVWDKSGISTKTGVTTLAGVVDAGYRGELQIAVINLGQESYTFEKGKKIAQGLVQPVVCAEIEEVLELSDSSRGEDGFGSTGV
jgi:dUTP pyrophosphatase